MSTRQKRKGTRLEKRVVEQAQAQGLTARLQPGSGIYQDYPSDAVIENLLIECKCGYERLTANGEKTFTFQMAWLNKVEREAKQAGYHGAVVVVRPGSSRRALAVVDLNWFLEVLKKLL